MNRKLIEEIKSIRNKLKKSVVIPAHHYEFPDVVALSDFVGDSYKLAVECSRLDSDFIVFCGVSFMAEGASLLCKEHQKVLIPEMSAGCPMAKMIDIDDAQKVYEKIRNEFNKKVVPVVYVNSYADVKSFCGEKEGATCTSSNAAKIIKYFLEKDKTVFFFPDFNLGKNTAFQLGIKDEEIIKVNRDLSFDRCSNPGRAKIFIWDGFCYVHKKFKVTDIEKLRNMYKNISIIVHPECDEAVVRASDLSGSTQKIYESIKDSPSGSVWGVGTDLNFVKRIASEFKDKTVIPLCESSCADMEKISLEKLRDSLLSITSRKDDELKYEISVASKYRKNAKKALKKMIEIVEGN